MKAINTRLKENQVPRKKTKLVGWVKEKKWSKITDHTQAISVMFGLWYVTRSQWASTWWVIMMEMYVHELEINGKIPPKTNFNKIEWSRLLRLRDFFSTLWLFYKSHRSASMVDDWGRTKSQWNRKRWSSTKPSIKGLKLALDLSDSSLPVRTQVKLEFWAFSIMTVHRSNRTTYNGASWWERSNFAKVHETPFLESNDVQGEFLSFSESSYDWPLAQIGMRLLRVKQKLIFFLCTGFESRATWFSRRKLLLELKLTIFYVSRNVFFRDIHFTANKFSKTLKWNNFSHKRWQKRQIYGYFKF